jgi:hypothetical protein
LPAWELYDLEKDPKEKHNVYHDPAYAKVVKEMKEKLEAKRQAIGDTDEQYPKLLEIYSQTDL